METSIPTIVTRVERVSPGFMRVALAPLGDSTWESTGTPDEFVHVEVGAEALDADGHTARHYTVSAVPAGGLELEIALHGHGPGAAWGLEVRTGDRVDISEPKAFYAAPEAARERVLLGDATALPAIARILAEAGADERFRVVIELADLADRRDLPSAATVDLAWRVGGNGAGPCTLGTAARSAVLAARERGEGDPYVWIACESKDSRALRTLLRHELAMRVQDYRIVGYWHADLEHVMAIWSQTTEEQREQYAALWREDRSDEENWLEAEPFLQSMGV